MVEVGWRVILLAGFMAYAEAGVIITSIDTSFDDPRDSGTSTAYIGDNGMRAEARAEGENNIVIFRSDKEVFWMINTADNSYTEMTKKDIKKIKGQMDEAMRMMQEQMKNMPPEQRAMMEQMMKGKTMPTQPEKTVFKKVASGVKVGKWKCNTYKGYLRGELTEEVCSTSWKNLGIKQKDFRVMKSMGEFMSELSPDAASQFNVGSDEWEKEHGYPGVPVRTISYSMGKKVFQTEIQDVKKQKIDSSLFELPKGLTKKSFTGTEN
ncbi:MAG: DUF3617 domain-containing protein [Candidatus Mariimomonas ferrooxydans]